MVPFSKDVKVLEQVIKRLNEADKLSKLEFDLIQADRLAREQHSAERKPQTTVSAKQKQFRERRKAFEYYKAKKRMVESDMEGLAEVNVNMIEFY